MTRVSRNWRLVLGLGLCLLMCACGPTGLFPAADREDAADSLFRQAESLYRGHRYAEAGALYDRYVHLFPQGPDSGRAWLRSAELLGIRGDWVQARSRYEQLAAKAAQPLLKLRARVGVGQANFKLGNYPAATQILEGLPAADMPPDLNFKTNALLTEIALKLRDFPRAFTHLNQTVPNLPEGEEEWFRDLKTRFFNEASPADLQKLAQTQPNTPLSAAVFLRLAQSEFQAGRSEQGRTWLQQLLTRFPDSPEAAQARQLWPSPQDEAKTEEVGGEIGCLLPLTGSYAKVGEQVRQGMELAAAEGHWRLVIKDCQGDPVVAARLVKELADDEQIKVLVGPVVSVSAVAAAQAAQTQGLPIITMTQRKDITGFGHLVFRDFLTAPQQVRALVNHTANRLGLKRYAILYPESTYGQTFARLFQEEVHRAGGLIVTQVSFPDDSQDFSPAVTTLAQAYRSGPEAAPAFEALFIPDDGHTVVALVEQLAPANLAAVRLLGTNLWNSPEIVSLDALQGALFPEAFFPNDPAPETRAFVDAYRLRYSRDPTYMAAQGYSTIKLAVAALSGSPRSDRSEVASRLATVRQLPGFSLFRGFAADREAELAIKVLTISGRALAVAD